MLECEFSRKCRPETIRGYQHTFDHFMRIMPNTTLDQLTSLTMTRFFKILQERKRIVGKNKVKVGIKKSTVATYWSKLNSFFEWLRNKNILERNPFQGMMYPTPSYEDRKFLKREELEKIIAAIHIHSTNGLLLKRNLAIFHTLLFCGLRREELLYLQIRDIDLERRILTVRAETSKIPRTRYVPLHSQLIFHLKEYLKERKRFTTPYLFVSSKRDERFTFDGLKHLIDNLNRVSKVRFHAHQFRHTFAVNFLNSNNNIVKLKQLMGHKSIQMTMVYLRALPTKEMRGDIERLRIDGLI